MKRGLIAFMLAVGFLLVLPAASSAETCTSSGGGSVPGHSGVVLGPATKCVRDGQPAVVDPTSGANVKGVKYERAGAGVPMAITAGAVAIGLAVAWTMSRRRRPASMARAA